jgi:hypothetical protein
MRVASFQRSSMRTVVIVVGLVMAACGGNKTPQAPATASTTPTPTEAVSGAALPPARTDTPAITVAPFKLIPTAKPDRAVDVKADGTVFVGGKMTMKFVGNELRAPEGQTILSLANDGTVTLHRKDYTEENVGTLNDKDEFSPKRAESRRMWLDDKGALKLLGAREPEPGKEPLRLEGVGATNRRAAMLMTILFFTAAAPAKAEVAGQPSATATPSTSDAGAPSATQAAPKTKR